MLSDKGMALMRKHKSYSNYLLAEGNALLKKEKIEAHDRKIKNIGILATLIISLLTLLLMQFPIRKDKQQIKPEEGLKSISDKLDSLHQVLQHLKITPNQSDSDFKK